ncbi:hypothetical protein M0R45_017046 [Rubus argutus]|uniref:Very-long-chain (3R)-3-hydroxyacyl-CoA dehydratase n=1 Tax=Rubus argutus TaxID=59490 RepID=A0AAW1XXW8_RUBAR
MPSLSNLYLFAYNYVQAIAWAVSLSRSLSSVLSTKGLNGAYASAGDLIFLCQMVAFLEVVHGAIGLVPSGVVFPLMQLAGRANCVYVIRQTREVQELAAVLITFVAWSISEVIRYSNYALNCIGSCPPWLTYLRYTAFLVLYPPGMGCETWLMYQALPFMKKYSFSYYNILMVVLFCYPFFCVKLYLHMVKQRRSKLGKQDKKKQKILDLLLPFFLSVPITVPGFGCSDRIEPVPISRVTAPSIGWGFVTYLIIMMMK